MKGILTFTIAAGVALTSSSIVQAASPAKNGRTAASAPASVGGSIGNALDRSALNRELLRLNDLLGANDGQEFLDDVPSESAGRKSVGTFTKSVGTFTKSIGSFTR